MPLKNYGVLVGKVVDHYPQSGGNPHYVVEFAASGSTYRVSVNLESTQKGAPQALQYKIDEAFGRQAGPATDLAAKPRALADENQNGALLLEGISANVPTLDFVRRWDRRPDNLRHASDERQP